MARKTNLEKILKHYGKMARGKPWDGIASLDTHYALGVYDMAKHVKVIRDQLKADYDDLWRTRLGAPPQAKATITVLRHVISLLDGIDEPQEEVKA